MRLLKSLFMIGALALGLTATAAAAPEMPVRGLCLAAPQPDELDRFAAFIESELGPLSVNTLVLRVDYNYQYESRPELRNDDALSREQVKQLVAACRASGIRLIPQVNLLGHQSWASNLGNLLEVYPEFDETPHVEMPEEYEWPNEDGLYCKSYCPLHPGVHEVVFDLVDEITEVFESAAFHAGMDEVFYIADERCPRCSGKDPARLFADEVNKIRDHLAKGGRELWIWGDRLIDGEATGIGMWEASENGTHPAIDWIAKDVVICDWHYERADPTATLFAAKGLRVVTCPWNKAEVALAQLENYRRFQENAHPKMAARNLGMMQTYWSSAGRFMDAFEGKSGSREGDLAAAECFRRLFEAIDEQ